MQFGGPVSCSNTSAPVQLSLSSAAISFVLGIITSPANLLICLVVAKDPNKNLRTPFNLFIVNIAIADLLVGSVVLPLSVTFHVCESMGLFYPQLIKVLHMSVFTSCTASALAICSLSFDRYIAITSPLKYRTRLNSSRVKKTTGLIWTASVLMSLLYFEIDFITYTFVYVNVIILFSGAVLAVVHCRVSRALKPRVLAASSINCILRQIRGITTERNAKVTKAFFTLLLVFFCCNFPSFVIIYTLNFCQVCDCATIHVLRDFGFLSLLVSSAINPFYYGFRLPHFKTALRKLWVNLSRQSRAEVVVCDPTLSGNQANELRCVSPNQRLQFNILIRSRRYSGLSELQNPTEKNTTPSSLPPEAQPLFKRNRNNKGQAVVLTRFRLNTL